jgi:hypothetical protein
MTPLGVGSHHQSIDIILSTQYHGVNASCGRVAGPLADDTEQGVEPIAGVRPLTQLSRYLENVAVSAGKSKLLERLARVEKRQARDAKREMRRRCNAERRSRQHEQCTTTPPR